MAKGIARKLGPAAGNWRGEAYVYEMTPPFRYGEGSKRCAKYVTVSSVDTLFSGYETMAFEADDATGAVTGFRELGCIRESGAFAAVLDEMGYKIKAQPKEECVAINSENGEKVTWTRKRTAEAFDSVAAKLRSADELWEEIKANAPKEIVDQIRRGQPTIDKAELMAYRVRADIEANPMEEEQP